MKLHLHIGAAFTGKNDLLQSLQVFDAELLDQGTYVPSAIQLRRSVRTTLEGLGGLPPIAEEQEKLLKAILPDNADKIERAIFTEDSWLGNFRQSLDEGRLYPNTKADVTKIIELFAEQEISLSVAIRNPAVLLHKALHDKRPVNAVRDFAARVPTESISWKPVIDDIRSAAPDAPLTIWSVEDRLLLWPRILRAMGADGLDFSKSGALSAFEAALANEGLPRLQTYLAKHPPATDLQFEKTVLVFLDKYAREEAFDETVDLPGWDEGKIISVSEQYEQDLQAFGQYDGVTVLLPETMFEEAEA